MIKILILIDPSTEFNRSFLTGLIRYANESQPWTFYRLPPYYKTLYGISGIRKQIKEWDIDAVITQWENEDMDWLKQLDIPVFFQGYKEDENAWFSKISGDYYAVGAMAAKFFSKRKYTNFAFYGHKNYYWSKGRAEGYRIEVEKIGGNYSYFESESLNVVQWGDTHTALGEWLVSLPKPVALLACDDYFALQVSEICQIYDIAIPGELALMGVDNDQLICKLSHPSISSIITNDENGGYNTGKALRRLIAEGKSMPFDIVINPVSIELRQSTEKYNILNQHILTVINYIEENVTSNISIEELTGVVPLARRNLEIKFKEETGVSIYNFVLERKIEYISHLLLTTNKNLKDIAVSAGYSDARSLCRVFKKGTGCTPDMFRRKMHQ